MDNQNEVTQRVKDWVVSQKLGTRIDFSLLLGDGSSRSFYRVTTDHKKSFILISDPCFEQTKDYFAHQKFLKSVHVPVPEFFLEDRKLGILLMEDLGNTLLQHHIELHPTEKMLWLEKSVKLLSYLHQTTYPVPAHLPVATRSFDLQKYLSEFSFTLEHLHQKLLGLDPLKASELAEIEKFSCYLAEMTPLVFCHRDYHCRNLMLHSQSLYLIDFQDSRLGPPHYDLASLVFDAYIELSESERVQLVDLYKSVGDFKSPVGKTISWKTFSKDLGQVAFQRTVKAAGSFASFFTRFGKTSHLTYLVPALKSALQLQKSGSGTACLPIETWLAKINQLPKSPTEVK